MLYENALDTMYLRIMQLLTPEEWKASQKMTELYSEAVRKTCNLREEYLFGNGSKTTEQELQIWDKMCDDMLAYAYSHGWMAYETTGCEILPGAYPIDAFIPVKLINKYTNK